ncbi:MAG: anti-sigma factor [Reyranella sp.]|uniref:anti-sigma factor family protein n=1 Tax=Reyranella sp. TaxID=1929291 RepID=UPI00120944D9|nr:anti-sigma factor [Reyranella sp.]TAJ94786.1 MAG: anti-sigma factor [Reyranella sp.]TBR29380.1 MAG: anti-sigma factor [Reyranella sp.]
MTGPNTPMSEYPIGEDELQAFIDERLDGERRAAVEAHLAARPDVAERIALERRQRAILRGRLDAKFAEPIPGRLRIANLRAVQRTSWVRSWTAAAASVIIFVAGATAGWFANEIAPAPLPVAPTASVAQGAHAAYRTFVVEVAHPVEVGVQQEAHLLQWLSKRLGRKLAAPDLSGFGYRLMGGRLLPGGNGAAAQLMYDDASGRRLTIYVRAADGTETAFRFQKEGEASTFAWIDQGFGFAVTATASREELLPIAEAVYRGFEGKS